MGTPSEAVARRLREAREALGLTQTEMAAQLCVKLRAYQLYEGARRLPQAESLMGLQGLGISADWLLTGGGAMHAVPANGAGDPPSRLDFHEKLSMEIAEGVSVLQREERVALSPGDVGRLVVRMYCDLINVYELPGDRQVGLRLALEQLRYQLRRKAAGGDGAA